MPELTIAAVEVEAVRGPAGRFPYPVQWQVVPLNVYLAPGETADAPAEPDPAAIVELLEDEPKRHRLGKLGRARVEQELAWGHQQRAYLDVYQRLTSGGNAPEQAEA